MTVAIVFLQDGIVAGHCGFQQGVCRAPIGASPPKVQQAPCQRCISGVTGALGIQRTFRFRETGSLALAAQAGVEPDSILAKAIKFAMLGFTQGAFS
jgi:hypothetical protein